MTRRRRPRFTRGSRRCGAAAFAASFGRKPYGAAAAAHGTPGDRPLAVPAVSRCRARQHHGQAVALAPSAPIAVKMSQRAGRNAAHCPGRPLRRNGALASRCAGRACGAPLTPETSASPAGLTARARPEARPEGRAANLSNARQPCLRVRLTMLGGQLSRSPKEVGEFNLRTVAPSWRF